MPKIRSIFILGILIFILPFLGFPASWKTFFSMAIGFLVSFLIFLHYKEIKKKFYLSREMKGETPMFVENRIDNYNKPADEEKFSQ